MHIAFAAVAALVLIALTVRQMRSKQDNPRGGFVAIAIIALMIAIYYTF
jgi:hypothetical protein